MFSWRSSLQILFMIKNVSLFIALPSLLSASFDNTRFSNFCGILKQNYFLLWSEIFQGKCSGINKNLPEFKHTIFYRWLEIMQKNTKNSIIRDPQKLKVNLVVTLSKICFTGLVVAKAVGDKFCMFLIGKVKKLWCFNKNVKISSLQKSTKKLNGWSIV